MAYRSIEVHYTEVAAATSDLDTLANEITNRSLNVVVDQSKGATVDAIMELAKSLEEYGKSLGALVSKCSGILKFGIEKFQEGDEKGASQFKK